MTAHPIHVPPKPAMIEGLTILAREAGEDAFDALLAGGALSPDERVWIDREDNYGDPGGIWSDKVPGTLKAFLPEFFGGGRWAPEPDGRKRKSPAGGLQIATADRWAEIRRRVREAGAPWRRLLESMKVCGLESRAFRCTPCGDRVPAVYLPVCCQSRYCGHCARTKRERSRARAERVVAKFESRIRMLTLTIRSEATLERGMRQLRASLTKLRRRKWWRDNVTGGLQCLEVTIAPAGFHPHAHILVDALRFLPQPRIVDEWMSVNGCKCHRSRDPNRAAVMCCREKWTDHKGAYETCTDADCQCTGSQAGPAGVNIKAFACEDDAVREVCKYAVKELGTCRAKLADGTYRDLTGVEMAEIIKYSTGRRMLMTFGKHFDLEAELAEQEEIDQEGIENVGPLPECPRCTRTDYTFLGVEHTPIPARKTNDQQENRCRTSSATESTRAPPGAS